MLMLSSLCPLDHPRCPLQCSLCITSFKFTWRQNWINEVPYMNFELPNNSYGFMLNWCSGSVSSTLTLLSLFCFHPAEIQSCLVSSGDVGCGMFQCFNNSCEIQGLHHICLTLLHNAGRYDSQVRSRTRSWSHFTWWTLQITGFKSNLFVIESLLHWQTLSENMFIANLGQI